MSGSDMSTQKPYIKVRDVMSKHVDMIDGLATAQDAIEQMKDKSYGALIVKRRDETDEYGFVTVQDIARQVIEPNLSPERVSVYEIMEKPVLTIHGDMNIRYAIRLLDHVNQQRALVIDNHEAAGIITMMDMVMHYLEVHEAE
jgi:predicted transcriptional regulator